MVKIISSLAKLNLLIKAKIEYCYCKLYAWQFSVIVASRGFDTAFVPKIENIEFPCNVMFPFGLF